jgi:hypothetical protein
MNNRDDLDKLLGTGNYLPNKYEAWQSLSPEQQARWIREEGGTHLNFDLKDIKVQKFLEKLLTEELVYDPEAKNLMELIGKFGLDIDEIKKQVGIASQTRSPIILDLDGDGKVETVGKNGIYFDHDNNGFAELTGWVSSEDGLLVFDKNSNGQIDDGTELFGNNTILSNGKKATNGFEVLKDYDKNSDGKIDKNDEIYSQLKVWQDKNQNGKVDENELFSLEDLGIESLNTNYVNSNTIDENKNAHKQLGSFTKDGETYNMNDVWFDVDLARTQDLNKVEISEDSFIKFINNSRFYKANLKLIA